MSLLIKSAKYISVPDEEALTLRGALTNIPGDQGTIFALVRIFGKPDETRTRIAEVILERVQRFQDTLGEKANIPRRFEQLLQALNEDVSRASREGKRVPLSDMHAVVGLIHKNQVFVSGVGTLSALFMHRSSGQRYVIYELDEHMKSKDEQSWDSLFVTVLDGELHHGDIFYLATRASAREITLAELQDVLVTLPPSGALKRIQQHLNLGSAYGGICFRAQEASSGGPEKKVNPMSSMNELNKTREETTQLLGEQGPEIKQMVSRVVEPVLKRLSAPGKRGTKSTFMRILGLIIRALAALTVLLITLLSKLWKLLLYVAKNLPVIYKKGREVAQTEPTPKQRIVSALDRFNALSPAKKYAGVAGVLVVILLIGTFSVLGARRSSQQQDEAFNLLITRVEEKKNAAEASLIYDDTDQAYTLLQEAIALLETVPIEKKDHQERVDEVFESLRTVLLTIQGIEYIDVQTLGDLTQINPNAQITASVEVAGVLYVVDAENQLYRLNELDQTFTPMENTNGSIEQVRNATARENDLLFIDGAQQLGVGSVEASTLNPGVSGVEEMASAEDLIVYNESLYVLSAASSQIVKMRTQGDGYEAGTPWISAADSDLTQARALAIDGDIFILTNDRVLKFSSGREQTFNVDAIDPALSNPVDIWTDIDSNYLYILDAGEGRIVVLDKGGGLVTQYLAEELKEAQTMTVREDDKVIIATTNAQAIQFTASHLLQ